MQTMKNRKDPRKTRAARELDAALTGADSYQQWQELAATYDRQTGGVEHLHLALFADFRHEKMSLVAISLVGGKSARASPVAALVFPFIEPAVH